MGLGKTIQSVCFLDYLRRHANVAGPSLIVAPLSTIQQWKREFSEWTDMNCIVYWGTEADRDVIRQYEWRSTYWKPERELYRFHVIVTTYEVKRRRRRRGRRGRRHRDFSFVFMKSLHLLTFSPSLTLSPSFTFSVCQVVLRGDVSDLSRVNWRILIVDEAHRLKNQSSKLIERFEGKERERWRGREREVSSYFSLSLSRHQC